MPLTQVAVMQQQHLLLAAYSLRAQQLLLLTAHSLRAQQQPAPPLVGVTYRQKGCWQAMMAMQHPSARCRLLLPRQLAVVRAARGRRSCRGRSGVSRFIGSPYHPSSSQASKMQSQRGCRTSPWRRVRLHAMLSASGLVPGNALHAACLLQRGAVEALMWFAECFSPTTSLPEGDLQDSVTGSSHLQNLSGWPQQVRLEPTHTGAQATWGHALQSRGLLRHCLCCMLQAACQRVLPVALAAPTDARPSSVMRLTRRRQALQRSSLVRLSWKRMTATSLRCSLRLASQVSSTRLSTMHLCLPGATTQQGVSGACCGLRGCSAAALEAAWLLPWRLLSCWQACQHQPVHLYAAAVGPPSLDPSRVCQQQCLPVCDLPPSQIEETSSLATAHRVAGTCFWKLLSVVTSL